MKGWTYQKTWCFVLVSQVRLFRQKQARDEKQARERTGKGSSSACFGSCWYSSLLCWFSRVSHNTYVIWYIYIYNFNISIYIILYLYLCIRIYLYIYIYIQSINLSIYLSIYVYIYTHIYTHVYIYIYTYIHAWTQIYERIYVAYDF